MISWIFKKQQVVARSNIEAKYIAMDQITTDVLWMQSLFKELCLPLSGLAVVWRDNIGANSLALNLVFHSLTKQIKIDFHFIQVKVALDIIKSCYVPTAFQVANVLTIGLCKDQFQFLYSKLILIQSP